MKIKIINGVPHIFSDHGYEMDANPDVEHKPYENAKDFLSVLAEVIHDYESQQKETLCCDVKFMCDSREYIYVCGEFIESVVK